MRTFYLAVLVLLAMAAPVRAGVAKKAALKILKLLKQVDGVGSGLDADTLRGMAPGELGGGLVVRDTHGAFVGRVFSRTFAEDDAALSVVRQVDGTPVEFFVRPEGFLQRDSRPILYTTPDCSGQGFIEDTNLPDAPLTTVFLSYATVIRGVAYYAVGATIAPPDTLYEDDPPDEGCASFGVVTPRGSCCQPGGAGARLAPVKVVDPARFGLVPPFHVEGP